MALSIFGTVASALFLVISTLSNDYSILWSKYKDEHGLEFSANEDTVRFRVFAENMNKINQHNSMNSQLVLGMNQFTHWTHDEYLHFLKRSYGRKVKSGHILPGPVFPSGPLPDVDWRTSGIVSRVKNQGQCGSCWAFSATGALESQYAKKTGKIITLSEQDLVDCSKKYGNEGCNGGLMSFSFNYVKDFGINSDKDYPYTARDGNCKHNNKTSVLSVTSFVSTKKNNETDLAKAVSKVGPVSFAFDASDFRFMFYKSGVYSSTSCKTALDDLNHGMLIVGIGSKPSTHFIIKNSWGSGWGNGGYGLVARNGKNTCGIATDSLYPIIKVN